MSLCKQQYLFFVVVILLLKTTNTFAQPQPADVILGDWMDPKKETVVHCFKSNGKYYGRLVWMQNLSSPGQPVSKQDEKHLNYLVLKDFEFENSEWVNGIIHQPKTNKTYTAYLKLINNDSMEVIGYKLFRFLSESQIFTRVTSFDVLNLKLNLSAN